MDFGLRTLVLHCLYLRSLRFNARNLKLWTQVCGLTMFRFWIHGIYHTSLEFVDFGFRTLVLHYLDLRSLRFNARNLTLWTLVYGLTTFIRVSFIVDLRILDFQTSLGLWIYELYTFELEICNLRIQGSNLLGSRTLGLRTHGQKLRYAFI